MAIAMAFGFYLRSTNLSAPSFNEDELFHVRAAEAINATGRPTLPGGREYHRAMPYTRLMAVIFRIAGENEFTARIPSAIFGTLLIWLTYLVGVRLCDRSTGMLAASLVTVSPFMVVLSRFARMYAPHQCLYLLAFLQFYRAYEYEGTSRGRQFAEMALAGALLLAAARLHEITAFFFFGLFGYCAWRVVDISRRSGWRDGVFSLHGLTVMMMTAGGVLAFAIPVIRAKLIFSWTWVPEWAQATVSEHFFYRWFLRNEYGVWSYLAVAGAGWLLIRRSRSGAYLVAHFLIPMLILSLWPLKQTRYMAHLFPLYLVLLAAGFRALVGGGLTMLFENLKNTGKPLQEDLGVKISAISTIVVGVLAISITPGFTTPTRVKAGDMGRSGAVNFLPWREASAFLKEHAGPEDVVIASRPAMVLYYFGRVNYSFDRQADAEIKKLGVQLPNGRWLDNTGGAVYLETTDQFKAALETNKPVWLALQNSLFRKDRKRLSAEELKIIESDFHREYESPGETISIFKREATTNRR